MWLAVRVELTADQRAELRALTTGTEVSAAVGTRARIVLWLGEGRAKKDIAALAGGWGATGDLWLSRFCTDGAGGVCGAKTGGGGGRGGGGVAAAGPPTR